MFEIVSTVAVVNVVSVEKFVIAVLQPAIAAIEAIDVFVAVFVTALLVVNGESDVCLSLQWANVNLMIPFFYCYLLLCLE